MFFAEVFNRLFYVKKETVPGIVIEKYSGLQTGALLTSVIVIVRVASEDDDPALSTNRSFRAQDVNDATLLTTVTSPSSNPTSKGHSARPMIKKEFDKKLFFGSIVGTRWEKFFPNGR